MDASTLEAVEQDLVRWGLLERGVRARVTWTRRFRARVLREAARFAREERAGVAPPGRPLATTVLAALDATTLPSGARVTSAHARFLVGVELAALPARVRGVL